MEESLSNVTLNSSKPHACGFGRYNFMVLSLLDVIPVALGQPVMIRLLFITSASTKASDILNFNLALVYSLQYLLSIVHLIALLSLQEVHGTLLKFVLVYAQIGGPMSLCLICAERYVAVIHPTSYPLLKRYRLREVCAALVWLFSVPVAAMNLATEVLLSPRDDLVKWIPFWVLLVMTVMMMRCSVNIAWALRRSSPGRGEVHPGKRRALKIVCATSAIVFVCYTPVSSLQLFKVVDENMFECVATPLCILLMSAASVAHPLLYLSTQGKLFTCLK